MQLKFLKRRLYASYIILIMVWYLVLSTSVYGFDLLLIPIIYTLLLFIIIIGLLLKKKDSLYNTPTKLDHYLS